MIRGRTAGSDEFVHDKVGFIALRQTCEKFRQSYGEYGITGLQVNRAQGLQTRFQVLHRIC